MIIPTPKAVTLTETTLPLRPGDRIAASDPSALSAARWLQEQLREVKGVACTLAAPGSDARIMFELRDGLGQEHGYVLEVTERRATLAASAAEGFRNATASLLQLTGDDGVMRGATIEDGPDIRFRVADWLLNVEANRWGYERGDGAAALLGRLRRKIDLAARYKLNVIWFDGFGWDIDRAPGYARSVRELARYARARGIRLAHAGYGGGYGFAYQTSELYSAPYMGQVFENRRPYPGGPVYECIGEPSYPTSTRYGTCLSNSALLDAKLDELVRFVGACEPGMLYIHDIDAGTWEAATGGWQARCSECRRRWPSDELAAEDGMAGAYATWFRMVTGAVGRVRSDDGEYAAADDCELAFVGPVYTGAHEPDDVWDSELAYFETLSRLIGPAHNLEFGIREQFVSGREPRLRTGDLANRLDAVGNGHGVLVACFAGGDTYYSDQLVAPSATLNGYFLGARTVYVVGVGSVAEPGQVIAAQYAWNATAPGAAPVAGSREAADAQVEAARAGRLRPEELYGAGGLLEEACRQLYGDWAGPAMAEVLGPHPPERRPVPIVWHTITREARRLLEGGTSEANERRDYWLSRREATRDAAALVARAVDCDGLSGPAREDLAWTVCCLEVGECFCAALAELYEAAVTPSSEWRASFDELGARIEARMPTAPDAEWFDPLHGDVGAWRETLDVLRSVAGRIG